MLATPPMERNFLRSDARRAASQSHSSEGGKSGVRQYGNAVTFAAFLFGDTARQRIRRELAWVSGKANFQKSPYFKPPRLASLATPPMEWNFLKSDARRAASQSPPLRWREIWSAAIRGRSDLCRFVVRRYWPSGHSPGVGAGFRDGSLSKVPALPPPSDLRSASSWEERLLECVSAHSASHFGVFRPSDQREWGRADRGSQVKVPSRR